VSLYLHYSAISDVGRVRRENQDSGYAGPWLLTVCDGVGGAVRGDLASSTAVQALRKLDQQPDEDILGQVAGAVHRADDRIAELVEEDPALNGTSTTATVALFDGTRFGVGHIGDSRAYLYRRGELRQLTHDHTFVQSLIDEGRITEEQSRTHPHRNLILKALDGIRHEEPDLFEFPAEPGDRVFLCSDGACGTLTHDRMAEILGTGGGGHQQLAQRTRASRVGLGVGRALIDDLVARGKERDWVSIYWITAEKNKTAQKLYDSYVDKDEFIRYCINL
jgi:protein phosphatase